MKKRLLLMACSASLFFVQIAFATDTLVEQRPDIQHFINDMVQTYHFKKEELTQWFNTIPVATPAEKPKTRAVIKRVKARHDFIPWYQYKEFFIKSTRIDMGVKYWLTNKKWLDKANRVYGIPQSIITATIGIESKYGRQMGGFEVFDSLAVLSFDYSHRQEFFRRQLIAYLLYCRRNKVDPVHLCGSYEGAIGQPQFMPTNIKLYGVDFDGKGKIDILHDAADAIGSVAKFYHINHWHKGEPVATLAVFKNKKAAYKLLKKNARPHMKLSQFAHYGIYPKDKSPNLTVTLVPFREREGLRYWLLFHNFYVIKNYNASNDYAMALYQLSLQIKAKVLEALRTTHKRTTIKF